jgi:signal transduction histidine kinase
VSPFGSVGGRLALALLTVVVGVLAIVYLIVVPSYQSSLTSTEIRSLEASLRSVVASFPSRADSYMEQSVASRVATQVDARVIVYHQLDTAPAQLSVTADSNQESSSSDVADDPVALAALEHDRIAHGVVRGPAGGRFAEAAASTGSSVVLLRASLHSQLEAVDVVRRRVFVAGAIATVFALLIGYGGARLFAGRIRRLELAAEQLALGDFDAPVVDHRADELGQLARAFERMRLRLATLDRARREFIANASHELRTPLFSLGGFLELLDDPDLDEPTREEFLAQMREQVARLTRLATNLLDLSRLDAGRLVVAHEVVDLGELADELVAEFGPRAQALEHVLEVAPSGVVQALADAERVLQIGRILVENAIVHTPPATRVRISTGRDGGRATLAVANDGPEIPLEAREQIFARFYRLDGARASGSGLGLAIARELAGLMGGRIELGTEGAETVFTLVLRSDTADRELADRLAFDVKTRGAADVST